MGSAKLDLLPLELAEESGRTGSPDAAALRRQVAERLAAHRERRRTGQHAVAAAVEAQPRVSRRNPIAAAVAERYAQTPSYRAFLAEQAQRAVDTAAAEAESKAAEAEIAARNAQAIAAVQEELLAELELWTAPQEFTPGTAEALAPEELKASQTRRLPDEAATVSAPAPLGATADVAEHAARGAASLPAVELTVRLYEELERSGRSLKPATTNEVWQPALQDGEEAQAFDEEIAFRQAPAEIRLSDPFTIEPPTLLPANLLEFPRQLVAPRKARPRLAEGPLAEEVNRAPQLRIFEVQPEQISTVPNAYTAAGTESNAAPAPEWAGIRLDAHVPVTMPSTHAATTPLMISSPNPQTAPFSLRVMAASVDFGLIATGLLGFVAVVAHLAHSVPAGLPAVLAVAGILIVFAMVYHLLFFTFSDQTPGMRYARIGFCTLQDENPSRAAIRRRLLALAIAICPFGLGVLWALLDDDHLGWHDRISRIYPRAY